MTTLSDILTLIETHDIRAGKWRDRFPYAWVTDLRAYVTTILASNSDKNQALNKMQMAEIIRIVNTGGNPKVKINGELSASGELAESLYQLIDPESRKPIFNAYVLVNIIRHLRPEEIAQLFLLNKELSNSLKNEALWEHATRTHFSFQYHQIKSSNSLPWLDVFKSFRINEYRRMYNYEKILFSAAKSSDLKTMIKHKISKYELTTADNSGVKLFNYISQGKSQYARNYIFNTIIKPILEKGKDWNSKSFHGYVRIHWIALLCQKKELQYLIDSKAIKYIDRLSDNKRTPLQLATHSGHHEIVELLLSQGAQVNKNHFDSYTTPVYMAAQNGYVKCLELLVNHLDEEEILSNLERLIFIPMKIASQQGHLDALKLLLEKTKSLIDDPLNTARAGGNEVIQARLTPLHESAKLYYRKIFHLAVQFGHDDIIEELLNRYPSLAVDPAEPDGPSPLHIAASQGHGKVAKHLLFFKADLNASYNGLTPLQVAISKGNNTLVDLLTPKEEERVVNNPAGH